MQMTKDHIFNTAVELFSEKGYDNISTREIARAAGINESTAYYYYKSKKALLDDILDVYRRKLKRYLITKEQVEQYLKTDTPRELLERFVPRYKDGEALFMLRAHSIVCMEFFTNSSAKDIVRDHLFDKIADSFQGALDALIAHGEIAAFDTKPISILWSNYLFSQSIIYSSRYYDEDIKELNARTAFTYSSVLIDMVLTGKLPETCM